MKLGESVCFAQRWTTQNVVQDDTKRRSGRHKTSFESQGHKEEY